MPYDTLESAQERILELEGKLADVETERDTLSENNKKLTEETENLRTLNQKYFNKLIAQETPEKEKEEERDVPTCEDFALSLNL